MDYFIKRHSDNVVFDGPWPDIRIAAIMVDLQPAPTNFGTTSRHYLAKDPRYPKNKRGDAVIRKEIEDNRVPVTFHVDGTAYVLSAIRYHVDLLIDDRWFVDTECHQTFPLSVIYEYNRSLDEKIAGTVMPHDQGTFNR